MKSLEPCPERSTKSPLPGQNSDFVRIPSPELAPMEKGSPEAKIKPLVLDPVVSAFSTYRKDEPTGPIADMKRLNQMEEGISPNTSISSLGATWTTK